MHTAYHRQYIKELFRMTHTYHSSVNAVHDTKQQNPHFDITIAKTTDIQLGIHSADIHV